VGGEHPAHPLSGGLWVDGISTVSILLALVASRSFMACVLTLPSPSSPLLLRELSSIRDYRCRKMFLLEVCGNTTCDPKALIIKRYFRFGNNFRQLLNALHYAQVLNLSIISVPSGFIFLNSSFTTTAGVRILVGEVPDNEIAVQAQFYFTNASHHACFREGDLFLASTFRAQVLRSFPKSLANESRLYEHMRSADVFRLWRPHPWYGQPPCNYYIEAVGLDGSAYSEVQIIAEDGRNPCVSVLIERGAKHTQQAFVDDLGAMLWASKLVLGRGTLGPTVLYLSQVAKRYYTFDDDALNLPYGRHIDCEATSEYAEAILGTSWKNSARQRHIMKTSKACRRWRVVTQRSPVSIPELLPWQV
jgi:hypothetical protein